MSALRFFWVGHQQRPEAGLVLSGDGRILYRRLTLGRGRRLPLERHRCDGGAYLRGLFADEIADSQPDAEADEAGQK